MRIAAGLVGILVGISSLFYIGLFGGILGTATSWLGSGPWSNGDPSVKNLGELISLLSYLSGLLAIVGGIVAFSRTRIGGVILAGSAFSHWYLLGLGVIGKVFVLPIAAAAAFAFLAARSSLQTVPLDSSRKPSNQTSSNGANASSSFDLAKWNALVQYDKDIAAVELRLRPLGQKWLDQLASSYLALSDKSYLPEIEQKIVAAAKVEAEENEQVRIRLEEMRKASMQAQERRAKARQMQFELWRDRLWGTAQRKAGTITACSLILAATAVSYLYVTAPPPRPTARIVWSGAADNCLDIECLRGQMQKSGANIEAIQFAERLSASIGRGRATAWSANGIHHFGHMDIVTCSGPNESGGLVFVDRDLRIINPNITDFEATLRNFTAFTAQHPQAFVIGEEFVGTTELPDGRISFSLQYPIADCKACAPLAALQVPWDFNKAGSGAGMEPATLRPWSQRLPAVALN